MPGIEKQKARLTSEWPRHMRMIESTSSQSDRNAGGFGQIHPNPQDSHSRRAEAKIRGVIPARATGRRSTRRCCSSPAAVVNPEIVTRKQLSYACRGNFNVRIGQPGGCLGNGGCIMFVYDFSSFLLKNSCLFFCSVTLPSIASKFKITGKHKLHTSRNSFISFFLKNV